MALPAEKSSGETALADAAAGAGQGLMDGVGQSLRVDSPKSWRTDAAQYHGTGRHWPRPAGHHKAGADDGHDRDGCCRYLPVLATDQHSHSLAVSVSG